MLHVVWMSCTSPFHPRHLIFWWRLKALQCSGTSLEQYNLRKQIPRGWISPRLVSASHLQKQGSAQVPVLPGEGGLCDRFMPAACSFTKMKSTFQILARLPQQLLQAVRWIFHLIMMGNSSLQVMNVLIQPECFQSTYTALSQCSVYCCCWWARCFDFAR